MLGFGKKRMPVNGKIPMVSVADLLAKVHWLERHVIALESREMERLMARSAEAPREE